MAPLDVDRLIDRRRLKRQVSLWRVLFVLALVGIIAVGIGRTGWIEHEARIARLNVGGVITDDPDRLRAVKRIANDPDVRALIVEIDSPGGTVVGGESLYRELRKVAERKPVVAVMSELAASGGYMVAIAADHIVAREGTITGSIGVILQTTDVTGLLQKIGISAEAIKSAPLKAVPSPLEPLTEEARAATKRLVDDMFDMFVSMVAERRKFDRARALTVADGRVFTGRQALALGLIDATGGEDEALAWLGTKGVDARLPIRDIKIIRDDDFWRDMVGSTMAAITGKTYLAERLTLDGLVALWHPDLRLR
jgi:protease IV